jgi:hypothetical protein
MALQSDEIVLLLKVQNNLLREILTELRRDDEPSD